jgi:hypothetical protein
MKKSRLYKISALCLTFLGAGTFMAFDDAQTDEQKVEAAYQELVTTFNMEQDQLCKTQALAAAQAEYAQMNASAESTGGNDAPASSTGGNSQPASSNQGASDNTPPPPPPPPKPTTGKAGKMSGSTDATAADKKGKMSGDSKSGTGTTTTDKKKGKMGGK